MDYEEKFKKIDDLFFDIIIEQFKHLSILESALNIRDFLIVQYLAKNNSVIMSELISVFGTAATTMTGIINNLVDKDYVKRRRRNDDRRVVEVLLSQKGEEFYKKDKNMAKENARDLLEKIDDRLLENILDIFSKINEENSRIT